MTRADFDTWAWWNLWQRRLAPYHDLAEGDHVVLVDSWPSGGRLAWLSRVTVVGRTSVETKDEAVAFIARTVGVPEEVVRDEPHTASKPDLPGHVLAWRAEPLRFLGWERPDDLRFRRHGWLREDDPAVLASWGLTPDLLAGASPRRRRPSGLTRLGHGHSPRRRPRVVSAR